MLPSDSPLVLRVDFTAIKGSVVWSKFSAEIQKSLNEEADFREMKEKCGFDPVQTVSRIWLGGDPDNEKSMVAVVEGIPKDKVVACHDGADGWQKSGDSFTKPDGSTLGFLGQNVLIITGGGVAALTQATSKTGTFTSSAAYQTANTSAAAWGTLSKIPTGAAGLPVTVQSLALFLDVSRGVTLDLTANLKDESEANMMKQMVPMGLGAMQAQLEQAGAPPAAQDAVRKIEFSNVGAAFKANWALSNDEFEVLVDTLTKM